jgi:hypothetical protein
MQASQTHVGEAPVAAEGRKLFEAGPVVLLSPRDSSRD